MSIAKLASGAQPVIYEQNGVLSLRFGLGGAVQSEMHVDSPDLLMLDYTRMMMAFLLFIERPQHIGMIGLGGGSIHKHCYRYLPDTQISVAEISSEIIALRNKFVIPNDDHRFKVTCEDGAEFVKRHPSQFDVLIVDGFDVRGQPPQLCTQNFYDDCYRALAREGMLIANLCDPFPRILVRRMRECFGHRVLTVDVEDSTNMIVLAAKGNVWEKSDTQLRRNRTQILEHHSIDFRRAVEELVSERESRHRARPTKALTELCQDS